VTTRDPDFDKLAIVNEELEQLFDDGELTQSEWDRLFGVAEKAVGDHPEFLEGLLMRGSAWGFVTD
jgi:hypothetical protein